MTRATLAILLLLAAAPAGADPATAEAHERAAAEYFRVGNFEAALVEFRAAYALDPKPDYLYAMAAIEEQRGGCAAAIDLYERFLATDPPAEDVAVAREAIAACKQKLGVVERPPPEPRAEPSTPPPERRRVPFYRDVLGTSLVGAGAVATGVGLAFYLGARDEAAAAEEPGLTREEYDARWRRAQDRRRWATIVGGAGVAVLAAGAVRWVTFERWEETPVSVAIGDGGATLVVTGAF